MLDEEDGCVVREVTGEGVVATSVWFARNEEGDLFSSFSSVFFVSERVRGRGMFDVVSE